MFFSRYVACGVLLAACFLAASNPAPIHAAENETATTVLTSRPVGGDGDSEGEGVSGRLLIGVADASITSGRKTRKLAEVFRELRIPAVTHDPAQAAWGRMQKSAKASIDFDDLDTFVESYQGAGFTELMIILDATSTWGVAEATAAPTDEHLDAYTAWVAAVVERYDADGVDDLPGILRPVVRYQVGTRFAGGASAERFLLMLERAARSARTACEDIVIAHAGFFVTPAFVLRPSGMEEVETAFEAAAPALPQGLGALRQVLDRPDLFDVVNLEATGDPYEIEDAVVWLRAEMTARDYDKPVILGRVTTSPFLAWGAATQGRGVVVPPATEADRGRLAAYFTRLTEKDEDALHWVHLFAAADLVKKIVVAGEQDVVLMHIGPMEDLEEYVKRSGQAAAGNAAWAGMIGGKHRRPSFFAFDQVVGFLGDCDEIVRIPAQHDRVRVYEVREGKERRWVAWAESEELLLPGTKPELMEIDLPANASHLIFERLATGIGGAHPVRKALPARKGAVTVRLTPYPAFLFANY